MSARKFHDTVERCACGALACLHTIANAFGRGRPGYYRSCTQCGLETEVTESETEATADWNDCKVKLPPKDFAPERREQTVLFNPVMR